MASLGWTLDDSDEPSTPLSKVPKRVKAFLELREINFKEDGDRLLFTLLGVPCDPEIG